jgi:hypothetical protein
MNRDSRSVDGYAAEPPLSILFASFLGYNPARLLAAVAAADAVPARKDAARW